MALRYPRTVGQVGEELVGQPRRSNDRNKGIIAWFELGNTGRRGFVAACNARLDLRHDTLFRPQNGLVGIRPGRRRNLIRHIQSSCSYDVQVVHAPSGVLGALYYLNLEPRRSGHNFRISWCPS